jgi:tRNA A-37 threonylcarbamoyl transferase component Bud32
LDDVAKSSGFHSYAITRKIPLGRAKSRTICYTLQDTYNSGRNMSVVAKKFAKLKGIKWGALALSGHHLSKYPPRADPLFRLGTEYKALRYLRNEVGLNTPAILAIDLERRILVTEFVNGPNLLQVIQDSLKKTSIEAENIFWFKLIGKNFAMVHGINVTLGNLKPNSIILNNTSTLNDGVFFTSLDQFNLNEDRVDSICLVWDIIQFLCWSFKRTTNTIVVKEFVREFLSGYFSNNKSSKMKAHLLQELSQKPMDYLEQFYPLISSSVARSIYEEISRLQIE